MAVMNLGNKLRKLSNDYSKKDEIFQEVQSTFERIKKDIESQAPQIARKGVCSFVLKDDDEPSDAFYFINLGKASRQDFDYAKSLFHQLIQQYADSNEIRISCRTNLYKNRYSLWEKADISIYITYIYISW